MAPAPARADAAPMIPPINAWDELLGIFNCHVSKFHKMAAANATRMTCKLITAGSAIPRPIELATATPNTNGPANSAKMVIPKATRGEYARDETMVETTLRESCIPFRKPKNRVRAMMAMKIKGIWHESEVRYFTPWEVQKCGAGEGEGEWHCLSL